MWLEVTYVFFRLRVFLIFNVINSLFYTTTHCPWPGSQPRLLDPETSPPTMRPSCLHTLTSLAKGVKIALNDQEVWNQGRFTVWAVYTGNVQLSQGNLVIFFGDQGQVVKSLIYKLPEVFCLNCFSLSSSLNNLKLLKT